MSDFAYIGSELDLFAHALTWKAYFRGHLLPCLQGDVLEVGAGIGANTRLLCDATQRRWLCLEPDRSLAARIEEGGGLPPMCEVVAGTIEDLPRDERFEAILYVDVLEHIEDDRKELTLAAAHLKTGGALVVLAPAWQWLFTPFDRAIGHYRRYSKASLRAVVPSTLSEDRVLYLDSVGLLGSLGNRMVLRAAMPTLGQIRFWDRVLVPLSRRLDPLLGYRIGKSVLGVWRLPSSAEPLKT